VPLDKYLANNLPLKFARSLCVILPPDHYQKRRKFVLFSTRASTPRLAAIAALFVLLDRKAFAEGQRDFAADFG